MKKWFYFATVLLVLGMFSCKKPAPVNPDEPEPEPEELPDAVLMRIDMPFLIVRGQAVPVKGKVQNFTDTPITSLEIKWVEGSGPEHTATFDNLNIGRFGIYEFIHSDSYTASTTGNHEIRVWISKVNGKDQDANPSNNERTKTMLAASNAVQHIVLYEEFTSSTCGPCYVFNTNYFNESFLQANRGKYNLIKYQMNWPGSGDPYYTDEGGERRAYYGVNGVPTLFIDGDEGTHFDTNALQQDLDRHYALPGVFNLQAWYLLDTTNQIVKVKVEGTPYIDGQYSVRIAVVERETTGNATSNGETRFFNVMMKMVPDPAGTQVTVTDGTPFEVRAQASLAGTHIEEYDDLEIVVFIQDDQTKFVFQSATAVEDPTQIDF
ncbi:MAG: hypothetical protein GXO27_03790 [Chlorobi bacterium]|nr:hypothetical protein [Chlorobiota bacterium]